ncbi:hypothetical protein [Saccharothrix luteola]|uniref:hypothetical protein n=1 Tax=Saccharothrix luteola TaxID=2893018 RepID=UPI001E60768A|nr:hypothetical protein [Saccharothrix luteola]MCC8249349.1 hypothetical protein [Saccharothrix luteola]
MHTSGGAAETRSTSPSRLRDRRLAPVYALVTSFLAVVLLGAVAREPTDPPPAAVGIQFVSDQSARAVTGLTNAHVKVLARNSSDLRVNDRGQVDVATSGEPLTICLRLPDRWSAPAPAAQLDGYRCWPSVDTAEVNADRRVELVVTPPKGS